MNSRKKELDVDFIGSQEPLSASEQEALSEYFRSRKASKARKSNKSIRRISKKPKKIQSS